MNEKRTSHAFKTPAQLERWLKTHHAREKELWVRVFKKDSGSPSVDWNDCVVAAIAWGWIDGVKNARDDASYLQRLTPRRAKSTWSKKNCEHAEALIAAGRMQPAGLAHVAAAKADGRWDQAYAGSATMEIPADFLAVLRKNAAATRFYATLDRRNLFSIYHRLHTAKTPQTRAKRVADIVARLARGEAVHGPAAKKPPPRR